MEKILLIIILVVSLLVVLYILNNGYQDDPGIVDGLVKSVQSPTKDPRIDNLRKKIDQDLSYIIKTRIKNPKLSKIGLDAIAGGKRIRPIIAYSIIKHMNPNISDDKMMSVNSIELLHSASLMIDDMMDHDTIRRGKPSAYTLYGNNITLLASTQLVMVALEMVGEVDIDYMVNLYAIGNEISNNERYERIKRYNFIIKTIINKTMSLIDGQTLDLDNNKTGNRSMVLNVLSKKTSSIFEMIFIMSWILGGGDPESLPHVEKVADFFGIMFQIYDDFTDIDTDRAKGFNLNYALRFGTDSAREEFNKRRQIFIRESQNLGILTDEIAIITKYLSDVVNLIADRYPVIV